MFLTVLTLTSRQFYTSRVVLCDPPPPRMLKNCKVCIAVHPLAPNSTEWAHEEFQPVRTQGRWQSSSGGHGGQWRGGEKYKCHVKSNKNTKIFLLNHNLMTPIQIQKHFIFLKAPIHSNRCSLATLSPGCEDLWTASMKRKATEEIKMQQMPNIEDNDSFLLFNKTKMLSTWCCDQC